MAETHKKFVQELKVLHKKEEYEQWAFRKKEEKADDSLKNYYELQSWFKEGKKRFSEYQRQRIKNKYNNWVKQRTKQGKDCSVELFVNLQKYLKREEQKMQEFLHISNKVAQENFNKGHIVDEGKDDDVIYDAKQKLLAWKEKDKQYQKMKDEIEELRYTSDSPSQPLENGER